MKIRIAVTIATVCLASVARAGAPVAAAAGAGASGGAAAGGAGGTAAGTAAGGKAGLAGAKAPSAAPNAASGADKEVEKTQKSWDRMVKMVTEDLPKLSKVKFIDDKGVLPSTKDILDVWQAVEKWMDGLPKRERPPFPLAVPTDSLDTVEKLRRLSPGTAEPQSTDPDERSEADDVEDSADVLRARSKLPHVKLPVND